MSTNQNKSGYGYVIAGVSFLSFAGIAGALAHKKQKEIDAFDKAVIIRSSNISEIQKMIDEDPSKRVYIKLTGKIKANVPLKVRSVEGLDHTALHKKFETYYLSGLGLPGKPFVTYSSSAEDITFEVGETPSPGPKIFVSPTCLKLCEHSRVDTRGEEIGDRFVSFLLGCINIPWPYRSEVVTSIVPNNKNVFAVLDAVTDTNGKISLVETSSWERPSILTEKPEQLVRAEKESEKKMWKGTAIVCGILGSILSAAQFAK